MIIITIDAAYYQISINDDTKCISKTAVHKKIPVFSQVSISKDGAKQRRKVAEHNKCMEDRCRRAVL